MHGGEGGIFIHFLGFQTLIIILKLYRVCNLLQFSPSSNWLVFLWHSYGCCKCQCVCESFGHLCDTEPLWQEITKFCPKIHLKSGTLHNLLVLKVFTFLTILTKCKSVSSICFFYKFRYNCFFTRPYLLCRVRIMKNKKKQTGN